MSNGPSDRGEPDPSSRTRIDRRSALLAGVAAAPALALSVLGDEQTAPAARKAVICPAPGPLKLIEIHRLVDLLPTWSRPFEPGDWDAYRRAARQVIELGSCTATILNGMLACDAVKAAPQTGGPAWSRYMILVRMLVDIPADALETDHTRAQGARSCGGLAGINIPEDARSSLSCPVSWRDGAPQLLGRCDTAITGYRSLYNPGAEYVYCANHFPLRDLESW